MCPSMPASPMPARSCGRLGLTEPLMITDLDGRAARRSRPRGGAGRIPRRLPGADRGADRPGDHRRNGRVGLLDDRVPDPTAIAGARGTAPRCPRHRRQPQQARTSLGRVARPADRTDEPRRVRPAARSRGGSRSGPAALHRPRRLQADQRCLWPSGRRRGARRGRSTHRQRHRAERRRRSPRRRRVRRRVRRHRRPAARAGGRRPDRGRDQPAADPQRRTPFASVPRSESPPAFSR